MSVHFVTEPDPMLVLCAQQRDAAGKPTLEACCAFKQLHEASADLIYNFFGLKVANEQDAQDLTQETFMKAWRALPAKHPQAPFVAWLKQIAINLCKDYWKKRRKEPQQQISLDWLLAAGPTSRDGRHVLESLVSTSAEEQIITHQDIQRTLQSLSEKHRMVLLLQLGLGFSDEETAEVIEVSSRNIPKMLWRAKAAFINHYQALLDPIPSRPRGSRIS